MAPKTAKAARPSSRRGPRKRAARSVGLEPAQCPVGRTSEIAPLAEYIERENGCLIGAYREPLGAHPLVLAALPIDRIQPTPFQRDLSDAHQKRLAAVIHKTGRFLDPIIAVAAPEGGFWTPNGLHRLEAMRRLGARAITALVIPDRDIAQQILALNTERAHNLRERALEAFRIYRELVRDRPAEPESSFAFYLEDASLATLGVLYDQNRKFAGGAYHPVLRRVESFSEEPLRTAVKAHERNASLLLKLEEHVAALIARLKERGLHSPYLRSFVVARINPLRWAKSGNEPAPEMVLRTMIDRAAKFNVEKVRQQDLVGAYGAPDEAGE
ncbi:MAG TPA: ParB N-terminal domain-containing protein [Bryobacteraceae bacterium]|nr:ParB N-terminal domain-containing protein [Bryobacteraceae bacterium]